MTSETLAKTLDGFLSGSRGAVVMEEGAVVFDLERAKYSVSGENNKCVLHFWSEERNIVRRVLDVETKGETLRIAVQKFGQTRPTRLEICRQRDPRSASVKRIARARYQRVLERALRKHFADWSLGQLHTSFGPIYSRGLIRRGLSGFAVLGVNSQELQSSIDASLTFGILWLESCRTAHAGKLAVEGLKLFVPRQHSALVRERMAHLDLLAAKWELYELDERSDECIAVDILDRGNVNTRLVRCLEDVDMQPRFAESIAFVHGFMPEAQVSTLSPWEISFRCQGLEFARARMSAEPGQFRSTPELVFGTGAEERVLADENLAAFEILIRSVGEARHADGPRESRWWRMHPERWLESLVTKNVAALDRQFDPRFVYSQVPAFYASDRGMIDVLTLTRESRLAVIELKADEDIHLPLQGIDYWSRVAWHQERGEFRRFGYFAGREISPDAPLLVMVVPALRVHPTADILLRYISPRIDWMLLGIDERWRKDLRVVFRKRPDRAAQALRSA
jgi:hypothetical protein